MLPDLSKLVKFSTDKFNEYEKERDKKNKVIKEFYENVPALTEITKDLEESLDHQGQYSCWNCILIHRVGENSDEDTDKLLLNVINNLEIDLTEADIDNAHRIGDPKKKRKKVRTIISKFGRCYDRKSLSKKETFKRKRYFY